MNAILVHFGSHFASILHAPGDKNEAQNASPASRSQNSKFAYGYTLFIHVTRCRLAPRHPQVSERRLVEPKYISIYIRIDTIRMYAHVCVACVYVVYLYLFVG